ncbi:MAG TPA: hypothetical protein VK421_02115 [Pyrinomonadaceae bacterium]|nr:hypothetical protein [Pyrinomonadaceae bacterium]
MSIMIRVAVLALALIAGCFCVRGQVPVATSTGTPANMPPAPDLSKTEVPTVGFCDLVSDPEKYDSQVVRTKALIYFGFETSSLYLPACRQLDTWAAYDPSYDGKAKESKKLYKILAGGKSNYYKIAEVTIVGRFIGKKQVVIKLKDKTYYTGYGHMNMFPYQFIILRVESAKAAPADIKP